jgi:hypothetical protein
VANAAAGEMTAMTSGICSRATVARSRVESQHRP